MGSNSSDRETPPPEPLKRGQGSHSVLDIPPINIGEALKPLSPDDDILGEMLEGKLGPPGHEGEPRSGGRV